MTAEKWDWYDFAEDALTGFRGRIIGYVRYPLDHNLFQIQPECENDSGIMAKAKWIPENRVRIIPPPIKVKFDPRDVVRSANAGT